jgi:RHS repeat-associated protein
LTITDTDTGESDSLARAAFIQAISSTVIHYDYDGLYRLIEAQYTGAISATYGYDYDKVGNMIAYTETITSTTVVTRTFDNANRLETSNDASGNTVYTYDDNGNLTVIDPPGASGTIQYGYDQRNLMITSTVDGSAVASFAYDGMNNRLQQVDFTGPTVITTTYANDILGLSQVLIADDGTNQVVNLFGLDLILQDDGTGALALLADGLGSVRLEMVGGAVESTTTYSPYGTELAQEGTSDTVYGFTGEQEDGSTGLLYLRARYYSDSLMAFMSRDPWQGTGWRPGTLNYYTFAFNNPVTFTDPDGRCPRPPQGTGRIICIDLFIQSETIGGGFGYGDNRSFDYQSSPDASRAYIYLYLDAFGHEVTDVEVHINESCTRIGCFGPYSQYNHIAVQQDPGTKSIRVSWDLKNGFSAYLNTQSLFFDELLGCYRPLFFLAPILLPGFPPIVDPATSLVAASTLLPDINGELTLAPDNLHYRVAALNRDPYPSLEIYLYVNGRLEQEIGKYAERYGPFVGLNPIAPNQMEP